MRGNILKWFKHYTNAHKGNVLQDIYLKFGVNSGHGIYFRLVEYLADKWDGSGEPRFRILTSELRGHLKLTSSSLTQLALIIDSSGDSEFKVSKDFCDIFLPKLLEVRHRDALNAGVRLENGQHKSGGEEKREEKKKNIPTEDQHGWFTDLSKKYTKTFLNTTVGTKAKKRFIEQVHDETTRAQLELAMGHYKRSLDYDNRDRAWRSPKKTFETFLGTEKSGFFWREHIDPPNIPQAPEKVVL